jgi:Short C-terminal domain
VENGLTHHMKKRIGTIVLTLSAMLLVSSGCIAVSLGGGGKSETSKATLGEQMIDLQKAKDSGAITEEQYETQKAKLLGKEH